MVSPSLAIWASCLILGAAAHDSECRDVGDGHCPDVSLLQTKLSVAAKSNATATGKGTDYGTMSLVFGSLMKMAEYVGFPRAWVEQAAAWLGVSLPPTPQTALTGRGAAGSNATFSECLAYTPFIGTYQQEAFNIYVNYLQIFNPMQVDMELDEYKLMFCLNGCSNSDVPFENKIDFPVGAYVPPGGSYSVCTSPGLYGSHNGCDFAADVRKMAFTGDDYIALVKATDIESAGLIDVVDSIGVFSTRDPGSSWPVCGGLVSGLTTRHVKLVRSPNTCCGNAGSNVEFQYDAPSCSWAGLPPDSMAEGIDEWFQAPDSCLPVTTTTPAYMRRPVDDGGDEGDGGNGSDDGGNHYDYGNYGGGFLSHLRKGDTAGYILAGVFCVTVALGMMSPKGGN